MFSRTRSNQVSASANGPDIPRDAHLMGVQSLVGDRVYDADGNLVGTLEEIVIDTRTGCVRHVVLAVGGVLGIGRKRLAVPWRALNPDANYCRCVIDLALMQITAMQVPDDDPWLQQHDSTDQREPFAPRAGGWRDVGQVPVFDPIA